MLKLLRLTIVVPMAVFLSFDSAVIAAHAQDTARVEDSPCFMVTSSGRAIDLSNLCGPQSAKTKLTNGVFQVPIKRRHGGVPVVDVTFNGKQTFEMLVDTGASEIVLTPQMASAVGFTPTGTEKRHTAGGEIEAIVGHIASVEVAGAELNNPEVSVDPALGEEMGLLGESFFKNYDVTVKDKVIELRVRQA